jgi:cobalamin biosynthesis protein CobD/CbiB
MRANVCASCRYGQLTSLLMVIEVDPAGCWFDGFAAVVGPRSGIRGCWCMACRNSSLGAIGAVSSGMSMAGFGDVLSLCLGGDSVDAEWVEDRRLPRDGVYPGRADIERPSRACTAITLAAVAGALSTLGRR